MLLHTYWNGHSPKTQQHFIDEMAIAVVSVFSAGLLAVILAIVVAEIPRVVRLVRSIVLSIREEPYVEDPASCYSL